MAKLVAYTRILICMFQSEEGWVAKYGPEYANTDEVLKNGKILPEEFARKLFPFKDKYIDK